MSRIGSLVNPHIHTLVPYQPGKPIAELERELGIAGSIKLASNEAPVGPAPRVLRAIERAATYLNRYPEDSAPELRRALAEVHGVTPEQIVLGAGSNAVLDLLARVFLGPDREAVFAWPSFAMYPILTQAQAARAVRVPLAEDFALDVDRLLAAVTPKTRLLLLANPNNPTGTSLGEAEFSRLVRDLPEHVVLCCDEAYADYARRPDFPQSLAALGKRDSALVLRTFSKIYGLAGLRIGYGIGSPELVGFLERTRHPFTVSSLAQAAARAALEDSGHVAKVRELTHAGLAKLEKGLTELGLRYAPSDANFLLVEIGRDAGALYEALLRRGVITRPLGDFGLKEHLRVTAGLPEENEGFLAALRAELGR